MQMILKGNNTDYLLFDLNQDPRALNLKWICNHYGVPYSTVANNVKRNKMSIEDALIQALSKKGK